ncbi:MAG: hypothetical protein IJ475_03630 [Bacilli bacterium]|nr:hypothetical protein [Bacilli bacterium]
MSKFIKFLSITFLLVSIFLIAININVVLAEEVFPFEGVITADSLVVMDENGTKVTELVYGSRVTVTGTNEKGNRYIIKYDGGKVGYTYPNYVINVDANTLTTDQAGFETYRAYCDSMISQGFVESYCPYLYNLHVKHPNWTFKALKVESTIENASAREVEKVSLQTGNVNYWHYKSDGTPYVNEYTSSGNHYYYVNSKVISSFMDPRNSLFEETMFQFLNLEKNTDAINAQALAKVSTTGNLANYYNEFIAAAAATEINAIHLMARSRQEGANSATYSAVTGTFSTTKNLFNIDGRTLDGFYNFYNIGSYVDKGAGYTSSIQRGLAYAAGYTSDNGCYSVDEAGVTFYDTTKCEPLTYQRPWNTPEKAIVGGGQWIGEQYVKIGQNTNYLQKFNVSKTDVLFTHQYMTNAYAPASEAGTIVSAYTAGNLLGTNFEFIIPVYQNMQELPYQAVDKSNDSKLNAIAIDGEIITGFDKEVVEYNVNALTKENFVDVTASLSNAGATMSGVGRVNFENGIATVRINVVAEDGITITEYVINIKQVLPEVNITVDSIVSKMGVKVSNDFMYGISPGTVVNTLVNSVTNNKGNASVVDRSGKVKTSGNLATGDKITIKGTTESKTYIISVRGDTNGDGIVKINDLILVQSHILETRKLDGDKFLAGDVNYDGVVKINDLILVQSHILEKGNL